MYIVKLLSVAYPFSYPVVVVTTGTYRLSAEALEVFQSGFESIEVFSAGEVTVEVFQAGFEATEVYS